MAKKTMVVLRHPKLGACKYEITHAERLLRMPNNGGWELADPNYKYDKENEIIERADKGASNEANKSPRD